MRPVQTIATGAVVLALLLPAAAPARKPKTLGKKGTAIVLRDFDRRLQQIDRLLVEGEPQRAYDDVSALLQEMTDRLVTGPAVGRFLGLATVLRAVAAYHLGHEDEARWHWQVATQMFPEVTDLELTAYGDAGPFLKRPPAKPKDPNQPENVTVAPTRRDPGTKALHPRRIEAEVDGAPAVVHAPRKLETPWPRFPKAKRGTAPVAVEVQVIVGTDGRPHTPRILASEGELTLVCTALDALRHWRFAPAMLQPRAIPVEVYYNLKVNFVGSPKS